MMLAYSEQAVMHHAELRYCLQIKLERAEKLVTGLAGEKARWEASIADLEGRVSRLPVRCYQWAVVTLCSRRD